MTVSSVNPLAGSIAALVINGTPLTMQQERELGIDVIRVDQMLVIGKRGGHFKRLKNMFSIRAQLLERHKLATDAASIQNLAELDLIRGIMLTTDLGTPDAGAMLITRKIFLTQQGQLVVVEIGTRGECSYAVFSGSSGEMLGALGKSHAPNMTLLRSIAQAIQTAFRESIADKKLQVRLMEDALVEMSKLMLNIPTELS